MNRHDKPCAKFDFQQLSVQKKILSHPTRSVPSSPSLNYYMSATVGTIEQQMETALPLLPGFLRGHGVIWTLQGNGNQNERLILPKLVELVEM